MNITQYSITNYPGAPQAHRCSADTVRTHVKHIFQKTHTNRQAELVGLLLSSPAISF